MGNVLLLDHISSPINAVTVAKQKRINVQHVGNVLLLDHISSPINAVTVAKQKRINVQHVGNVLVLDHISSVINTITVVNNHTMFILGYAMDTLKNSCTHKKEKRYERSTYEKRIQYNRVSLNTAHACPQYRC